MLISKTDGLTKGSEKRVRLKCDDCGKITCTTYANYYQGQERRGWNGKTVCRACVCKISAAKRRGKPAHNKGKKLPSEKKGINHPSWKGGRYLAHDGYWMVYTGGGNGVGWNSYKKEHVLVVEKNIGRPLEKKEVVHHIDGDKENNSLDNLWLTSHSGHRNAHVSLQEIGYQLVKDGRIVFDKQEGIYKCMI
jgi:hypothetical protein